MGDDDHRQSSTCNSPTSHQDDADAEPGPSMSGTSVRVITMIVCAEHTANLGRTSSLLLVHAEPREVHSVCCKSVQDCAIDHPPLRTRARQRRRQRLLPVDQRQQDLPLCLVIPRAPHGEFGCTTTCSHQLTSLRPLTSCQRLDTRAGFSTPILLRWPGSDRSTSAARPQLPVGLNDTGEPAHKEWERPDTRDCTAGARTTMISRCLRRPQGIERKTLQP